MQITIGRAWRGLATAGAFAGALSLAGTAFGGECPANQLVAEGQGQKNHGHGAKGVTDNVLATIDLGGEKSRPRATPSACAVS